MTNNIAEPAIDRLAGEAPDESVTARLAAVLEQLDRVSDRADGLEPLDWDADRLPK